MLKQFKVDFIDYNQLVKEQYYPINNFHLDKQQNYFIKPINNSKPYLNSIKHSKHLLY